MKYRCQALTIFVAGLLLTGGHCYAGYAQRWAALQGPLVSTELRSMIQREIMGDLIGGLIRLARQRYPSSDLRAWLLEVNQIIAVREQRFFDPIDEMMLVQAMPRSFFAKKLQRASSNVVLTDAEKQAARALARLADGLVPEAGSLKAKLRKTYNQLTNKKRAAESSLSWVNSNCAKLSELLESADQQGTGGLRTDLGRVIACVACGKFFGAHQKTGACQFACGSLQWGDIEPCPAMAQD